MLRLFFYESLVMVMKEAIHVLRQDVDDGPVGATAAPRAMGAWWRPRNPNRVLSMLIPVLAPLLLLHIYTARTLTHVNGNCH